MSGKRNKEEIKFPQDCTILAYLEQVKLDRKIIDIAIAEMQTPNGLREDAVQEIRISWHQYKADLNFKPSQIAAYAHRIAQHTVLRVLRELGAPVRLPGSAFRKKEDGSTYVNPGLLAAPLEWSKLDDWMDFESTTSTSMTSMVAGDTPESALSGSMLDLDDKSYATVCNDRFLAIEQARAKGLLTAKQVYIANLLINGYSVNEICESLDMKRPKVNSELAIISRVMKELE